VDVSKFSSKRLFNIHFSLLHKYKGMYTSAWHLLNGEHASGVTLHVIDHGIDTGNIVDQIEFDIDYDDNCRDLYFKFIKHGIDLFKRNIISIMHGDYDEERQGFMGSSYYSRTSIDFSNLVVDLNKTAFEIRNQIRAFNFKEYQVPVVYGHEIMSAEILDSSSIERPGEILAERELYLDIATIDYDVRLY